MSKFDPSEIIDPKRTLRRREQEAEVPPPKAPASTPRTMTQSEFTSGGPARREIDEKKRNAKFLELMKKQQAPLP